MNNFEFRDEPRKLKLLRTTVSSPNFSCMYENIMVLIKGSVERSLLP